MIMMLMLSRSLASIFLLNCLILNVAVPCLAQETPIADPLPDAACNAVPEAGETSTKSLPVFQLDTKFYDVLAPLEGGKLEGKLDKGQLSGSIGSNVIRGYVSSEQADNLLSTVQRQVSPRIFAGLMKLDAKFDPDYSKQMAVQVVRAHTFMETFRKTVGRDLYQLRPTRDPSLDAQVRANNDPKMKAELARVNDEIEKEKKRAALKNEIDSKSFYTGMAGTVTGVSVGHGGTALRRGRNPISELIEIELRQSRQQLGIDKSKLKTTLDAGLYQLPTPLQPVPDRDIEAELLRARRAKRAGLEKVRTEMDAILTAIRQNPSQQNEAVLNVNGTIVRTISWDEWYRNFTRIYEPRLLRAFKKFGNPGGDNTVSLTVWPNCTLKASINRGSNKNFDAATLEAYRSLNGDPMLQFPIGSKRSEVSFLIDNRHGSVGPVTGVESQPFTGDKEIHR